MPLETFLLFLIHVCTKGHLRISSHSLRIEKGRYTIPKTPIDERICLYCNLNCIEDEKHLLTECPAYDTLRSNAYSNISIECPHFMNLSNFNKMIYMLTCEHSTVKVSGKFVYECFQLRKNWSVK